MTMAPYGKQSMLTRLSNHAAMGHGDPLSSIKEIMEDISQQDRLAELTEFLLGFLSSVGQQAPWVSAVCQYIEEEKDKLL
jgi:pyridoxal/pyridoxine/pyridoxamine kinase